MGTVKYVSRSRYLDGKVKMGAGLMWLSDVPLRVEDVMYCIVLQLRSIKRTCIGITALIMFEKASKKKRRMNARTL